MAVTYSQDLRDRVLAAYDNGMKTSEIASVFHVSPAWARRVKQRRREFGETTPRPRGGFRYIKIDRARLKALVEEQPDATLEELRERLGVQCSLGGVYKALRQIGLSFKKRRSMPRNRIVPMSLRSGLSGNASSRTSTPLD